MDATQPARPPEPAQPLMLSEVDITRLCSLEDAAEVVSDALAKLAAGEAAIQPRRRVAHGATVLHVMFAFQPGAGFSVKAYTTSPSRPPEAHLLFFDDEGHLKALMDADELGRLRTAAASLVAMRHMSRDDSRMGALLGAGFQAPMQLRAMLLARPLEEVRVWSRRPEQAERLCRDFAGEASARLVPVGELEDAVRGADIVTTATSSSEPFLGARHIEPGMHVNAMGSNRATARELHADAVSRADRIVVDSREEARLESGDLLLALREGGFNWDRASELGQVIAGHAPGRMRPEEVTLFESQGVPVEDAAVAALAWRRALQEGKPS